MATQSKKSEGISAVPEPSAVDPETQIVIDEENAAIEKITRDAMANYLQQRVITLARDNKKLVAKVAELEGSADD